VTVTSDLEHLQCIACVDVEETKTTPNFALSPVNIREGVDEISIPFVEALPTTEPPEYI